MDYKRRQYRERRESYDRRGNRSDDFERNDRRYSDDANTPREKYYKDHRPVHKEITGGQIFLLIILFCFGF